MNNLLIAQSGGPTAAINATVAGIVTTAYASNKVDEVFGAINGIQGVLDEKFINLREKIKSSEDLSILCQTPSAALGSCRLKLKDLEKNKEEFEKIVEVLRKNEIKYFIYIGGNDSMDTVHKLSQYCKEHDIDDITIVGAPKTIDNDLVGTDHCPGFGSAAKYIATTFAELERDCSVYPIKVVTIVEVMGRNAGWLTASSVLSKTLGGNGPDLIYLCEKDFDNEKFLSDVRNVLENKNSALIAISEGIKDKNGVYVSEQVQSGEVDSFGHAQISGACDVLENLVRNEMGCKVRSIELSLLQRCAAHIQSKTDIDESRLLGMKACQCVIEKENGIMSCIVRKNNDPYEAEVSAIPVNEVSNKEKKVPSSFINDEGNGVTEEMVKYLFPLIQGESQIIYEKGLPKHIRLF
ncbi:MAG: 6-phosphofructokinase [Lachnospirales bacterium]